MATISSSLAEAIEEEPKRFIRDLDFNKINTSKNPQLEFLRQIEKRFDKPTGIFLWRFLLDNYNTTNKIYKMKIVQEELDELPKNLKRQLVNDFYEDYKSRKAKEQGKRDELVKRPIDVPSHIREGKPVIGYKKTKSHTYTEIQERFLKSRADLPKKTLADEFNNAFRTKVTSVGIRDKTLRLLGKKK